MMFTFGCILMKPSRTASLIGCTVLLPSILIVPTKFDSLGEISAAPSSFAGICWSAILDGSGVCVFLSQPAKKARAARASQRVFFMRFATEKGMRGDYIACAGEPL